MATRGKKILVGALIAVVVVAVAGLVIYQRYEAGRADAEAVTKAPVARDLPVEEIRTKLASGNFREKLAAKKQIKKLPPADRLVVLRALLKDDAVATRTMAVAALGDMTEPEARALLEEVAGKDADELVRAAAAERLVTPPAEGGTP